MDNYPHQLSGGMRQRVVLALAFACEPAVIIADEPTTALDVSVQAQVIGVLKRMCTEHGTAVILITHDMGVVAEVADRVAVMYAGRVVESGRAARVLGAPLHPYSRGLMAAIPGLKRQDADLPQIGGTMPRPGARPTGCAFHPRCGVAVARCRQERPALHGDGVDDVACWVATLPQEADHAA
jgi:peptide/nickel transport system ATP-binding protein